MDWHHIYEYFKDAILNNQFAQGGFAIAILSGAFLFGRRMLNAFRVWFLRKTTMRMEILSEDNAYNWVQAWLADSKFGKKTQTLMVRDDNKGSCDLVPGEGRHFFFYKRKLFYLWNIVEPMQVGGIKVGYRRSIVLQIIPGNRKAGEAFIREAESHYNAKTKKMVTIYTADYWGQNWRASNVTPKRPLASVILTPVTKEDVIRDVTEFKNGADRYHKLNVPWRRGYLLHGKPGNGKTSLALAIASEFNYSLYALQLSSIRDDERLRVLCDSLPENAALLIEDIDCAMPKNREDKESDDIAGSSVTLSGLLNALDGVTSGEGRIVIMTTNHPEKLDPALIRPGRADFHIEVSTPTAYQATALFERFYGDPRIAEEFAQGLDYDRLSMAQLQVYMLKHKTAQEAINHKEELMYEKETQADQVQVMGLESVASTGAHRN